MTDTKQICDAIKGLPRKRKVYTDGESIMGVEAFGTTDDLKALVAENELLKAHESAIRTAAAALVEAMEKLFNDEYGIIYGENDIKTELAALKAVLETPTGKESE